MSNRDDWVILNNDLGKVCGEMIAELPATGPTDERAVDILAGFMRKAEHLLKATNVLAMNGLWEEMQGLARVAFELRLKFDYFLKMLKEDAENACQLIMDAWLLQRVKEWETSEWYGVAPEVKARFEPVIKQITERLTAEQIRQIRRNGFPGISVESCARELGHDNAYQIVYRRFGRTIHSSDYVEFMAGPDWEEEARYKDWRDPLIAYVLHFSVGGVAEMVNFIVLGRRFNQPLDELGLRRKQLHGSLPETRE